MVPDPVTCFKNSVYSQSQHFWLSEGGSLVLVDWLSSGRRESGEVWAFDSFSTLNQVSVEGKQPLLWDKVGLSFWIRGRYFLTCFGFFSWVVSQVELQEKEGLLPLRQRVGGLHVLAVVVIVGLVKFLFTIVINPAFLSVVFLFSGFKAQEQRI